MASFVALGLAGVGAFFVASATLGTLRFPDVFTRMHAITKAGTLGVGLFMAATAVHFGEDISVVTRAGGIILFTFLTAPVSAQMIGRAAYVVKAPRAPSTHLDELAEEFSGTSARLGPARDLADTGPEDTRS
ncbi:MAG: monovalent cation/H(+) antiporter subunit G [Myxococcales bacterium]|nr:monovalent cation/H(+) antiporter subunit G [Myxococcales bacterium]